MKLDSFGAKAVSTALHAALVLGLVLPPSYVSAVSDLDTDEWSVSLQAEPMAMRVFGADQHVLNVTRLTEQGAAAPDLDVKTSKVHNEVDGWDFAFRGDVAVMRNKWGVGATGFQFETSAGLSRRAAADQLFDFIAPDAVAPPGPGDTAGFSYRSAFAFSAFDAIAGESYWASFEADDPPNPLTSGDVMDFDADTDLDVWSADVYGIRTLIDAEKTHLDLLVGAKLGSLDMTNDTRHAISQGEQVSCEGSCHTSFSNHTKLDSDVLAGPFIALSGGARMGKFRIDGQLAQSVIFGDVDYKSVGTSTLTANTGDDPGPTDSSSSTLYSKSKDVAVPVTEIRVKALYDVTDWMSIGTGVYAGVWWDVEVPARTKPGTGFTGRDDLDEETMVFLGVLGSVEFRFSGP